MAKTTRASGKTASIIRIENELKKLKEEVPKQDINTTRIVAQSSAKELEGRTRHEIAKLVTWLYFSILLVVIVGIPVYNLVAQTVTHTDSYKIGLLDTLQGYQSVVGTLVGFVIAYYFKEKSD